MQLKSQLVTTPFIFKPALFATFLSPKQLDLSWVSDLCGGGAYNLAAVSYGQDIAFLTSGPSYVFVNPCYTVQNASCARPFSFRLSSLLPLNYTNPSILTSCRCTILRDRLSFTHY